MAELTVTRRFDATPERVFDAWLEPALAGRFLFATPDGEMIVCRIDARVGGRFDLTERRPGMGDVKHVGEYLEIDRPRRLVFTFSVPQYDPAETTVSLDFAPDGDGCLVTLTHTDVLPEWKDQTVQGWTTILESQARAIG